MKKENLWRLCKISIGVMIILTFTPLFTPSGIHEPTFIGMPYTLWIGIIEAFVLVTITWIGTQVHPGRNE